jgi:CheY-like chemotaxis protein
MRKKNIFIVEDENEKRDAIRDALIYRGFEVYEAKTVQEARELAEKYWEKFDVAVLDMRLGDPAEPHITGADIGIEFHKKNIFSPESIIFSAFAEVEYYKLGMELGVTAYLDKNKYQNADLVRYVRVIALRKALSVGNSETLRKLIRIVTHSLDRSHAVKLFCQKVFKPELEICLGVPFFFILTDEKNSEFCAGNVDVPKDLNPITKTLQAIAQAESSNEEPTPLDLSKLAKETRIKVTENLNFLQDALLLPIFNNNEHKISLTLVLLKEKEFVFDPSKFKDDEEIQPPNNITENPVELWKILNHYLKPTVVEHLLTMFSEWNHIKTTLREVSQICMWIGQEQTAIIRNSKSLEESVTKNLQTMANDLIESGRLLQFIEKPQKTTTQFKPIPVKSLLNEIWENIKEAEELENQFYFNIESDCSVEAEENDLYLVFSRLLQWFVKRSLNNRSNVKPTINIECQSKENEAVIIFTDKSNQLNEQIRKELFAPFTQSISIPFKEMVTKDGEYVSGKYLPLYIAKMIIEVKYGGEILDFSHELEGNLGHKFVLRFTKDLNEI